MLDPNSNFFGRGLPPETPSASISTPSLNQGELAKTELVKNVHQLVKSLTQVGSTCHTTQVDGKDYVIGRTTDDRVAIREKADWDNSLNRGCTLGERGEIDGNWDLTFEKVAEQFVAGVASPFKAMAANEQTPTGVPLFQLKVDGEDYLLGKTGQGVVFQKQSDWNNYQRTGVYIDQGGSFKLTAVNEKVLSALQRCGQLHRTLEKRDNKSAFEWLHTQNPGFLQNFEHEGQKYIAIKTNKGTVIQSLNDSQKGLKTGLFLPTHRSSEPAILDPTFDLAVIDSFRTCIQSRWVAEKARKALQPLSSAASSSSSSSSSVTATPPTKEGFFSSIMKSAFAMVMGIEETTLLPADQRAAALNDWLDIYDTRYTPAENIPILTDYIQSEDYERHAHTRKVYYNADQLNVADAKTVVKRREPVNIGMNQHYDKKPLKKLYGYVASAFNDPKLKKTQDQQPFGKQPNTIAIYSETYMWPEPGNKEKRHEIACLSLPAPALDSSAQPHYAYYIQDGRLNLEKYRGEMEHLAKTIVQTTLENKDAAFQDRKIGRLVISQYGQGAFLGEIKNSEDKIAARRIFFETLMTEIGTHADKLQDVEIVMSAYAGRNPTEEEKQKAEQDLRNEYEPLLADKGIKIGVIVGDIKDTARDRDMIVNAWDPHSAPGNGCKGDPTFDGKMGWLTGIIATQVAHLNRTLKDDNAYVPVRH